MKSNNVAMMYLDMSVDSEKATWCLAKACNDKHPKKLAHEEWKNLHKKYANTDILLASKLRQELHRLNLKEEGDPTNLFDKISTIQMQARKHTDDTILEHDICSKIITAEPKINMPVIRTFQ